MKTFDITNASDRTVAALFAWKTEDPDFDFDALTSAELRKLAEYLPEVDFSTWITLAEGREAAERGNDSIDYEALILARQDFEEFGY